MLTCILQFITTAIQQERHERFNGFLNLFSEFDYFEDWNVVDEREKEENRRRKRCNTVGDTGRIEQIRLWTVFFFIVAEQNKQEQLDLPSKMMLCLTYYDYQHIYHSEIGIYITLRSRYHGIASHHLSVFCEKETMRLNL